MWEFIQKIQQDPSTFDTFRWKNDSLWYKDRLYLYKNSQIKQKNLRELHTSPLEAHLGFLKTYHRVKKDFFWDGLKSNIQKFVAECLVFQKNKVETIKAPGVLMSSNIVAIMLQLLGLPSLILSTRSFVTNLEATVLYAQVLVLAAAVTWSAGTSP